MLVKPEEWLMLTKLMKPKLDYIKRFSMCNCLTLYMPDTYTAHGMTIDFFVKKAKLGEKISVYAPGRWPKGHPKYFCFAKKIDTFLFSPFNEVTRRQFIFGDDGIRYACIGRKLRQIAKRVKRYTPHEFEEALHVLEKRVCGLWPNAKKIIVFYDSRHSEMKNVIDLYNRILLDTLDWPVVQMWDFDRKDTNTQVMRVWYHYSKEAQKDFLNQIEYLEETRYQGIQT